MKPGRLSRVRNPWGTHSRRDFEPADDTIVRCPGCSRLMSSDFLYVEKECPNCRFRFDRKKTARDVYIESKQVGAYGGWDREKLDMLEGKPPSTISHSGNLREVGDAAAKLAAVVHQNKRAASKLTNALRNSSSVSQRARSMPKPRKLP